MKIDKKNFIILSKEEMKTIKGGDGSATADCGNGRTVTCTGATCVAFDSTHNNPNIAGHCNCATDLPGGDWNTDVKQCRDHQ